MSTRHPFRLNAREGILFIELDPRWETRNEEIQQRLNAREGILFIERSQ